MSIAVYKFDILSTREKHQKSGNISQRLRKPDFYDLGTTLRKQAGYGIFLLLPTIL